MIIIIIIIVSVIIYPSCPYSNTTTQYNLNAEWIKHVMLKKFLLILLIGQILELSPYDALDFKVFLLTFFAFKGNYVVVLINECYRGITEKLVVIRARKMLKKVFLHVVSRTVKFSVIIFLFIPSKFEKLYSLT